MSIRRATALGFELRALWYLMLRRVAKPVAMARRGERVGGQASEARLDGVSRAAQAL